MEQPSWQLRYRPDIDGLRAISVLSVLIYHLHLGLLPGGFVGVDVFFVISGYLITTLLIRDLSRGQLSYISFLQRRIARLLPTILLVLIATLIAARLIYSQQDFASVGASTVAAILSIANVKFYFQGSYFQISPDAQPLLHFWSLAVEEQYYIIFPILLIALSRVKISTVGLVLAALTVLSFVACVIATPIQQKAAFYLLPFRLWELGLGGLAAFCANGTWGQIPQSARRMMPPLGVLAIVVSLVVIHENMAFPGYVALLPTLGAAAIMVGGHDSEYLGKTLLCSPPMLFIGKLSYALYLWHWPVFCFVDYQLFSVSETSRILLKIGLSLGLSLLSYFFVERHLRYSLSRPGGRVPALALLVVSMVALSLVGLNIRERNYISASIQDISKGSLTYSAGPDRPVVLLAGDSNAAMYAVMMRDMCAVENCTFVSAGRAAGDGLPAADGPDNAQWKATLALVQRTKPDLIVFANAWSTKLAKERDILPRALEALAPYTKKIILLNQPPFLPANASRIAIRQGARAPFFEDDEVKDAREQINVFLQEQVTQSNVVVDVASVFTAETGEILFTDSEGRQLFHDARHLSGRGAEKVRTLLLVHLP